MFKRLRELAKKLKQSRPTFDPGVFEEELAMKTGWHPLVGGGANFRTRKLIQMNPSRIEFQTTLGMKLFIAAFGIPGLIFLLVAILTLKGGPDISFNLIFGFMALIFTGASIGMYFAFLKPIVFDEREGYFWKGWKSPRNVMNVAELKRYIKLSDIAAIQILPEHVSSSESSYTSYEVNLVSEDANRLNVIDHGNYNSIITDAEILADFLNVPIWDAVKVRSRPSLDEEEGEKLLN